MWFIVGTEKKYIYFFRAANVGEKNAHLTILGMYFDPILNWLQNIH